MAQDTIRFRKIEEGSDLVAVAKCPFIRQGHLSARLEHREKGDDVEVVPPYKVYSDPGTGERHMLPLLLFEKEEEKHRWIRAVRKNTSSGEDEGSESSIKSKSDKDVKVWDNQNEIAAQKDDIG